MVCTTNISPEAHIAHTHAHCTIFKAHQSGCSFKNYYIFHSELAFPSGNANPNFKIDAITVIAYGALSTFYSQNIAFCLYLMFAIVQSAVIDSRKWNERKCNKKMCMIRTRDIR